MQQNAPLGIPLICMSCPHIFFFFFDGSPVPTLMSQPTSRFEPLNNVIKSGPLE